VADLYRYHDPGEINIPLGGNRLGGSGTETESFAEFADATYELTPQWFLTVGARFSHDNVVNAYYNPYFSNKEIPVPSIDGNKVTPRAVVRYKPTDASSIYASFSEGYKAAIIDVGGSCQDGPAFKCNPIKPEDVDAYEVGYKFESHGFSNEVAAYYYNYKNLQVSEFLGNAQAYIVNAAQSYEITDTIVHDTPLTHSPDYTATLGARYTTGMLDSGEYATSGNLYYSSKFYFSPSGTQFLQPSYTTLNLRAQWTHPSEKYTAALYVDNVTNERYRLQVQQGIYGFGAEWSPPVTWGVELGAKFR
jgi:iron complex outermembrane receptor protein